MEHTSKSVLYQVSLLQGLTYGDYNGSVAIKELKQNGDTGIGTFDRLNGELIMLDGTVYRAASDGHVEITTDEETTPFAVAAFLDANISKELKEIPEVRFNGEKLVIASVAPHRDLQVTTAKAMK